MTLRLYFILLLAMILLTPSMTVKADVVDSLEYRHTPGFPAFLNVSSISELLNIASPDIREALRKILECDSLDCIEEDTVSNRVLRELIYNSTGVNLTSLRTLTNEELLGLINDTNIRGLLESLESNSGDVTKVLEAIEEARARGSLSPQAYTAALELIRRVLEKSGGSQAEIVERRQIEALKELLVEASREGLLSRLLEKLSGLYRESQEVGRSSLNSKPSNLGFERPGVNLQLPSVSADILILALVAALASIIFLYAYRLGALIDKSLFKHTKESNLGGLHPVIKLYWDAVRLIERITGVERGPSTTHREYLSMVSGKLGASVTPFMELTQSYELYRFAGLSDRSLEDVALRSYDELRRLKEGWGDGGKTSY